MPVIYSPVKDYSGKIAYKVKNRTWGNMLTRFNAVLITDYAWNEYSQTMIGLLQLNYMYGMYKTDSGSLTGVMNAPYVIGGNYCTSNYQYPNIDFLDVPAIVYLEIDKVSNLFPAGNYAYNVVNDFTVNGGDTSAKVGNIKQSHDDFIAEYGDYYVVKSKQLYDNSIDHTVGPTNKRDPLAVSADIFSRMSFTGVNYLYAPSTGDGDALFSIYEGLFVSSSAPEAWKVYTQNLIPDSYTFVYSTSSAKEGAAIYSMSGGYCAFKTKELLTTYLNSIGIPFTYSETEAESAPVKDFTDYVPSGQPTDETGGGDGEGDNISDKIGVYAPALTCISAFNQHYAMSKTMLNELGNYLWNSTFLDDIKLLFNNPMEGVINCKMYPFSIPAHDGTHVEASTPIVIGNVETTATGRPISSAYNCVFDMGSIEIAEYFGTAMDYEPYTQIELFLPYIGIKTLSTTDVMAKTLSVKYIVDLPTGVISAQVWTPDKMLYIFEGKMGVDIPISSSNAAQFAASLLLTGATGVAGAVAGAVAGNPLLVAGAVLSTAKNVAGSQKHISNGGGNSPMTGFYNPQYCYIIITRPYQSLPSTFGATHGFPCNVSKSLGSLTGYTECDSPILAGFSATEEEKAQIKNLLETGVIIA